MFEIVPAAAEDVAEFASWQYEDPYDVYDITDEVDEAVEYFLDPTVNCHVLVESGDLVGFCTFGPDGRVSGGNYERDAVDIGMGIRPDLTGQGLGHAYVNAVVAKAGRLFPDSTLRVTIAEWNMRAVTIWTKAGFTEPSRFAAPGDGSGSNIYTTLLRVSGQSLPAGGGVGSTMTEARAPRKTQRSG